MRDGQTVTVRALTAMPGVADGEVRHGVAWTPQLATLVAAGRYEVVDGGAVERPAMAAAATTVAAGEPSSARRRRRR